MEDPSVVWRAFIAVVLIAFAVVFGILMITPAPAQVPAVQCGPYDKVVKHLRERYKETMVSRHEDGLDVFELYVSKKGTWTIIKKSQNGVACFAESGFQKPKGEA